MIPFYSRAALLKDRSERGTTPSQPIPMTAPVDASAPAWVSADAPYVEPEKTIHVFDAKTKRFIPHKMWLATVHIERDPAPVKRVPDGMASCLIAVCGRTEVWLVNEAGTWRMFAYTSDSSTRQRRPDFASPFLEHAIRTADLWYGPPADRWREEERKRRADVSTAECDGELAAGSEPEGYR